MKRQITVFLVMCFIFILFSVFYSFAQERITLTTYYPAPYGVYRELRADRMAIGPGYRTVSLDDGELLVNGSVGIGTIAPAAALDIVRTNTGDSLLRFSTDRAWEFRQVGEDIGAALELKSLVGSKYFNITSEQNVRTASFYASDATNSRVLLVPGGGMVGIGTTSPGSPLEISSTADNILRLRQNQAGNVWNYIEWYNSAGRQWWTGMDNAGNWKIGRDQATGYVSVPTGNFIVAGGNVGIGTANPQEKLEVNGKLKVGTGTITNGWPDGAYCIVKNIDNACPAPFTVVETLNDEHANRNVGGFHVHKEVLGSGCSNCPEADWRSDLPSGSDWMWTRIKFCCKSN